MAAGRRRAVGVALATHGALDLHNRVAPRSATLVRGSAAGLGSQHRARARRARRGRSLRSSAARSCGARRWRTARTARRTRRGCCRASVGAWPGDTIDPLFRLMPPTNATSSAAARVDQPALLVLAVRAMRAVPAREKTRAARLQHGAFGRGAREVRARVDLLELDVPPEDHAHVEASVYRAIEYVEQAAAAVGHLERGIVKRDRDPDAVARGFNGFADAPERRLAVHQRSHRVAGADGVRAGVGERDVGCVALHGSLLCLGGLSRCGVTI